MNNLKVNAVAQDAIIQRMQKRLYTDLLVSWGLTDETFFGYGRCYVIDDKGKKTVKWFVGKKEYNVISVPEGNKFFFLNRSISKKVDILNFETEIELIFIVDIVKLKPNILHRADLEVQADVEFILNQFNNVWVESIEMGFASCLNGIDYQQESDLQPYHVFKYNLGIRYEPNDQCDCGC